MLAYWTFFTFFAALALFVSPYRIVTSENFGIQKRVKFNAFLFKLICFFVLVFFIGFRYEVGGDWLNYKAIYFEVAKLSFYDAIFTSNDPLFGLINWIAGQLYTSDASSYGPLDWRNNILHGYVLVNIIAAIIFSIGLVQFSFGLSRPILGIVVAIPYLINVVSMGYVRQAAALGLIMYGITLLQDNNIRRFVILIIIASLIHKASLLMLPMAIFVSTRNRFWIFSGIGLLLLAMSIVLLESAVERIFIHYIQSEYSSSGAIFRLGMLIPPSVIFLYYKSRFGFSDVYSNLWTLFSFSSIFLFSLLFITSFSTFIDRIALFLLPLQIAIFASLPDIFPKNSKAFIIMGIVLYSCLVMFVWLNFAVNSWAWVPYENILFLDQSDISYKLDSSKT